MATYNDYPQSATNNAKKVLAWKEKYGDEVKGMTSVGWTRARQLASRRKLSYDTIARMAAFNRHRKNAEIDPKYKDTPWKDRGYVAWLGWGGTSGVNWAIKKAESIRKGTVKASVDTTDVPWGDRRKKEYESDSDKEMIDGIIEILIGIKDESNRLELAKKQIEILKNEVEGFDEKDFIQKLGLSEYFAEQKKDGTVVPSKKAPNSDTPEKNPQGVGKGGKLSPKIIKSIKSKVDAYNEKYPDKKIGMGAAKQVVLRGMGAYNKSHSPKVSSATQWGLARLNAFLYLLKNGSPQNKKYVQDNDLLPKWHKKSNK